MNGDKPSSDEGFLSRWSRRKLNPETSRPDEVQKFPDGQAPLVEAGVDAVQKPLVESEEQPPVLTDEDMPPIESLHENSDFTGFMSPGVSDELRKLALRKLFSGAAFNVVDGLDDYDEDYTSFEKLGDIITSDMRYQMERIANSLEQQFDEGVAEKSNEDNEIMAEEVNEDLRAIDDKSSSDQSDQLSPMENRVVVPAETDSRDIPIEK